MARVVVPDVLDATQCALLAKEVGYRDFNDPLVWPIAEQAYKRFQVDLDDPSYVRVECRKEGHDWHLDNGPHMPWVEVSASVLLTERPADAVGGVLQFHDIVPDQRPGELWAWDTQAENRHRVSSHDGWRVCLLMFLQGQNVAA
mgnify:FL=1